MVKNLPSNVGDAGSIPGRGTKISHATGQLSPHTATREKPMNCNKDPMQPKRKGKKENGNKEAYHSPNNHAESQPTLSCCFLYAAILFYVPIVSRHHGRYQRYRNN